ncbi:alanine racemase [Solicola gregarius]|uniref:Alanine racemase n=1 Tax=Solicola gregarius TaxID=2908642 RepID=A0AA46TFG5_9ACTN|nr:alanine racemase [Solicola gregarius]UYM04131.1 alanine racemase [Solicola gregarius]
MHSLQQALDGLLGDELDTPSPIVVRETMQRNIERMQALADERHQHLRPHVKTHKCLEIGRLQLAAGAAGITAGTVGEAEVFAAAGFDDIFLAYPVWPAGTKGRRIRRLAERVGLRVGVDSFESVDALADAMGDAPDRLQIVVEVDCGARRSGTTAEQAGRLAAHARARGLVPVGIYTYPGHGGSRPEDRVGAAKDQDQELTAAVRALAGVGVTAEVVSAGSTPTVEYSTSEVITEVRPGEYVFCDRDNVRLGACTDDQIALFVASTVVSTQVPGQAIMDVGTKALGREGNPQRGYGGVAGDPAVLSRLNEYHGYLQVPPEQSQPTVGTVLPVVPNHVCPVVNSFEELVVTDAQGASVERWPVAARGLLG